MIDATKKVELEIDKELHDQMGLCYSSIAIALHDNWGWGSKRIMALLQLTDDIWQECAKTNKVSIIQMAEQETGIDIKCKPQGKSWNDLAFLNSDIHIKLDRNKYIYMRKKQKEWIAPVVTSCLMIALHRKYDFGYERLSRLLGQAENIKDEYKRNPQKIRTACREICGIKMSGEKNVERVRLLQEDD